MAFNFKQFAIDDSECAMKVGTDSVLLGSWLNLSHCENILDIGTGCGILALMAAQESTASIVALELDSKAFNQADKNIRNSPWSNRIACINSSIQDYSISSVKEAFDHVITNPPYFSNSLKSPVDSRNKARHNDDLPFDVLVESVNLLLRKDGKLSVVLPLEAAPSFVNLCIINGFNINRQLDIKPKIDKPSNRILLEFIKGKCLDKQSDELSIRDEQSNYTSEYKSLTKGFYLNF